jgi:alkanesulfonate monooxygenase SsuD/methylene tetrahydromethanopterin reductase-like flavin-dependent oxidoreductase (luciferase family)
VTLSAIAGATKKIRLTTGAIIAPTRSALLLAKMAASLDVLSSGRFSLGLTAGWYEPEFRAVDVVFADRFARLDETIAVCRNIWGSQPATFSGRWTHYDDVYCQPAPLSGAGLPIWFGGLVSARTAVRVARCDGWIVSEATAIDDLPRGIDLIRAAAEPGKAERFGVRATVRRNLFADETEPGHAQKVDRIESEASKIIDAGATDVVIPLGEYTNDRNSALELASAVVATFRP